MKEQDWAVEVTERLRSFLSNLGGNYRIETSRKLCYANEVRRYGKSGAISHEILFETDILIYEHIDDEIWTPRIVIETKINSVTTHDAITYSKKAQNHRAVHPFLRYGMLLGNMGEVGVPARVLRHGENFDFMIAWKDFNPSSNEIEVTQDIVASELMASQTVEKVLFNNRSKDRERHFAYHKPLLVKNKYVA
jgi:hypothetical protein